MSKEAKLEEIMEQAQVLASARSLSGGRFDNGSWRDVAEAARNKLRKMVAEALAAQRKPLTTQEIRKWWASENGLEDCAMSKLNDFEQVVRAVEAKLQEKNS